MGSTQDPACIRSTWDPWAPWVSLGNGPVSLKDPRTSPISMDPLWALQAHSLYMGPIGPCAMCGGGVLLALKISTFGVPYVFGLKRISLTFSAHPIAIGILPALLFA